MQSADTDNLAAYQSIPVKPLIDSLNIGILFFDQTCRIVLSNRAALTTIQNREWLWLSDKRLKSTGIQIANLEKQILNAIQFPKTNNHSPLFLRSQENTDYLLMDISSLNSDDDSTLAVCLIIDPKQKCSLDSTVLREMFNLTETEAQITSMIADGLDYKEIATGRKLSIETIRSYSKSIFKKAGVNSRAGLVCKVHSTLSPLSLLI